MNAQISTKCSGRKGQRRSCHHSQARPTTVRLLCIACSTGQRGAIQLGGTANPSELPLVYLTVSQPVIGEEVFAAGAYLMDRVGLYTSVLTQDVYRIVLIVIVILGVLARTLGLF